MKFSILFSLNLAVSLIGIFLSVYDWNLTFFIVFSVFFARTLIKQSKK